MPDTPRKKILYIITKGSPMGGAQKYVLELASGLPENFETVVAVGQGDELPKRLEEKGVRIIHLAFLQRDVSIFKEWAVLTQLVAVIRRERPDVVHLNSSKIGGLGALAARIARVPNIVFTAHGWAFNERRDDAKRALIWCASLATALLAHKVITVSEREKSQAEAMPLVKHKVICIPIGVNTPNFMSREEARNIISEKVGRHLDETVPWIGTIAELHKNKNLPATIDAMAKLKDPASLIIIGSGEERSNLEKQIIENNLSDKVFLIGAIPHAAQLLPAFDIFTLNSTKEGLPYTILEAGLARLPVLASPVGGIPEVIEHKKSGFLVRPHAKEIMLGLQYLITNPDEAKIFGETLHNRIEKDFSFERMRNETLKIY